MKPIFTKSLIIFSLLITCTMGQSQFSTDAYTLYLQENQNLTYQNFQEKFLAKNPYYKGFDTDTPWNEYAYFDTIVDNYKVTDQEKELLKQNRFVVTERLNFDCFGTAFHDIYVKDLPVFISTDAILHALHASYDQILIDLEISLLKPNLSTFLDSFYDAFPQLMDKYEDINSLHAALEDVDLYVTIARSLLMGTKLTPQLTSQEKIDIMWNAIQNENLSKLPLFSERERELDFSQFTVRGHYNNENLRDYFKAMMWLGRMDFFLTPPPKNPWQEPWSREEIRRMNLGAFLLNELIELTEIRASIQQNEDIITFMVGESDNITPTELSDVIEIQGLTSAEELLNDETYDAYLAALKESNGSEQKILSQFMMMDPFSKEPGELPISFRLMGQRFIVDSYIFFNVVFDRIIYQDKKIWRPLPDPLDALFALGNDDALQLLKDELETYAYSSQLAALRYLIDSYDEEFWQSSLYNVWLNAIRQLNPPKSHVGLPLFMQTAAWHQNKINTQLASWSQLRHDNLLYAKQSYTGATGCLYPHSFIEPVPEFYAQIAAFAENAQNYFDQIESNSYELWAIKYYFPRLKTIMDKLELLARKELDGQPFSTEETDWLKEMLFEGGMSGEPPYTGWYSELYYHPDDAANSEYIVADVHTQPTDEFGTIVGNVLHVGTAKINLGIFLTENSSSAGKPIAYIGPVMSYYEHVTKDFKRLTDELWTDKVNSDELPDRPDWVNIYLTNVDGNMYEQGRELSSVVYTDVQDEPVSALHSFQLYQNYPNPFNPETTLKYSIPNPSHVTLSIYNVLGEKIVTLVDKEQTSGVYAVKFNAGWLPSGIYFCRLQTEQYNETIKLMLIE